MPYIQFSEYATAAESTNCSTVASTATITTNPYAYVGESKKKTIEKTHQ